MTKTKSRIRLLDKNHLHYKGVILIPTGDLNETKQLAIFISQFLHFVGDDIPQREQNILRNFKDRAFSIVSTVNKNASFGVRLSGGIEYVPNSTCYLNADDLVLVPVGDEETFKTFSDIVDHILWNNTDLEKHTFYKMLNILNQHCSKIPTVLKKGSERLTTWVKVA